MSIDYFKQLLDSENEIYISSSELLCESAHNHLIFKNEKEETLDDHVSKLTQLITGKEFKTAALAHLLVLLPQCNEDIIAKYGARWVKECSQLLSHKQRNVLTPALLTLMRVVFRYCLTNQELSTNISKLNGSFLPQICSVNRQFGLFSCLCLAEFFNQFPTHAGTHKQTITGMLMQFLHLPLSPQDEEIVSAAGRCFAAISISGDSTVVMKAKSSKLEQLMSLAHTAMDVLFKDVSESEVYDFSRVHKLPNIALNQAKQQDDPLVQLLTAVRITIHCFTFIRVYIETTTVEVQPRELALLVLRVLQVNINLASSSGNMEAMALSFVLPSLHSYALRFMRALIKNRVCEPFTNSFENQLVATLISTENMTGSVHTVKRLCYEALTELIQVTNEFSLSSLKKLLPLLKNDTVLMKSGIKLRKPLKKETLSIWNIRKKSRKKGNSLLSVQENDTDRMQDVDLLSTIGSVLVFLEALFITAGYGISGKDVTVLQNRIWDLLYRIQHNEYVDTSIRIALYRLVLAFALHPHPLCPPPYAMIHWALEGGTRDSNILVSEVCCRGLTALSFVGANPSVASWSNAAWQSGPAAHPPSEQEDPMFAEKQVNQNGGAVSARDSYSSEEEVSNESHQEEVNGVPELSSECRENEMEQIRSGDEELLDLNKDNIQNEDSSSSICDENHFSSEQDNQMNEEEEETSLEENGDQNGPLEEESSKEDDESSVKFPEEKVSNSSVQKRRKKSSKAAKAKKLKSEKAEHNSDLDLREILSTFVDSSPD